MIKLELEKNFKDVQKAFNPTLVEKALMSAVNKTSAKAKTRVSKEIRSVWNIKAKDVNRHSKLLRARRGAYHKATLLYTGKKFGLINFSPSVLKSGVVKVKVLKTEGRQQAVHEKGAPGFIASFNKGRQIFARSGGAKRQAKKGRYAGTKSRREPIVKLAASSVPEMIHRNTVAELRSEVSKEFPVIFDREYNFYRSKA
jgi:hypothetical protein